MTFLYLPYLPSGMQLRPWVFPGSKSGELHWTLPSISPVLSMNLKWMTAVEVASLTFFTVPTLNFASPRLVSCLTFQPTSVLCLPTVKALPEAASASV